MVKPMNNIIQLEIDIQLILQELQALSDEELEGSPELSHPGRRRFST